MPVTSRRRRDKIFGGVFTLKDLEWELVVPVWELTLNEKKNTARDTGKSQPISKIIDANQSEFIF